MMQQTLEQEQREVNIRRLLTQVLQRPSIRALTLTQPWAMLVALNAKQQETRSWKLAYRGPVAIHAAKGFPAEAHMLCKQEPFRTVLCEAGYADARAFPIGHVIALGLLDDIRPTTAELRARLSDQERAFGNYSDGRYVWHFATVYHLATPVAVRGSLGLWGWTLPDGCRQELSAVVERLQQREREAGR